MCGRVRAVSIGEGVPLLRLAPLLVVLRLVVVMATASTCRGEHVRPDLSFDSLLVRRCLCHVPGMHRLSVVVVVLLLVVVLAAGRGTSTGGGEAKAWPVLGFHSRLMGCRLCRDAGVHGVGVLQRQVVAVLLMVASACTGGSVAVPSVGVRLVRRVVVVLLLLRLRASVLDVLPAVHLRRLAFHVLGVDHVTVGHSVLSVRHAGRRSRCAGGPRRVGARGCRCARARE